MMYSSIGVLCLLAACLDAPQVIAFVPVAGGGVLRSSRQSLATSITSSRQAHTRMALGQENDVAHTRAESIEAIWKAALTAGTAQVLAASSAFAAEESVSTTGLKIKKVSKGSGPQVTAGDLIGVRFKGNYGTYEFDNIFGTAEPYYMRAGVGTLVPGVEEALLQMRVGDKWELTCPPDLAFGNKGRPPSPGRPRIPPGATVEYTVELVSLPGKEDDILDLNNEPLSGPAFEDA